VPTPFPFSRYRTPRALPSFPTRRSSDLSCARLSASLRSISRNALILVMLNLQRMDTCLRRTGRRRAIMATEGHRQWQAAMKLERSEEHTSELQSREKLVCRLLLEKKKQA